MDFWHSLSFETKILAVVGIGMILLAFFTHDRKKEKRFMVMLTVLLAVAVFRHTYFSA